MWPRPRNPSRSRRGPLAVGLISANGEDHFYLATYCGRLMDLNHQFEIDKRENHHFCVFGRTSISDSLALKSCAIMKIKYPLLTGPPMILWPSWSVLGPWLTWNSLGTLGLICHHPINGKHEKEIFIVPLLSPLIFSFQFSYHPIWNIDPDMIILSRPLSV